MKKRYKILSVILALAIVISTIVTFSVFSSSAAKFTDQNGMSWTVTENNPGWAIKPTDATKLVGEIIVPSEYKGEPITMIDTNFSWGGGKELTSITIPDSVTSIGNNAFSGCVNLSNVKLGNGLKTIGSSSFERCTSLASITIPDSVTTIYSKAFSGCTALSTITIPSGVVSLSGFDGCTGLTSITIPDSVTSIGSYAFQNCTGLTSITIPNSVTTIDAYVFKNCTGLTSIEIPDSVTSISNNVFDGCVNLTNIKLGNGLKTIGTSAFANCTGLTSITIPDGVTTIDDKAFSGCVALAEISIPTTITGDVYKTSFSDTAWYENQPNGIVYLGHICLGFKGSAPTGNVIIKDGTTVIVQKAFYSCTNIKTITLPNSLTAIPDYAFYGCTGLTSIDIPDSVTSIGSYAFNKCTGLTSIEIPDSVTSIGGYAFNGCTKLAEISLPTNVSCAKTSFNNTAWLNAQADGLLYLDNTLVGYKGTAPTGNVVIKEGTTSIGTSAFANCTGLTSIEIPDSVTSIGNNAFSDCTGLTSIDIPDSITSVGSNAFLRCSTLSRVNMSNNTKTLNDFVFAGCTNLTSIEIPDSVTSIGNFAFQDCKSLTSITIPDSVTIIKPNAFQYCNKLSNVEFGNGIQIIDDLAFDSCTRLTSAIIPDCVTSIGSYAFYGCKNIETINLPDSLESVDSYAFAECGLIENFTINCSFDSLDSSTFYNDTFINVTLGSKVDKLENEFSNMDTLENIVIPDTVTNIKDTAFTGSNNVTITTPANSTAHKFAESNNIPVKTIDRLKTDSTVSFEVNCDKSGYEFTVYRVADLNKYENPYGASYDSLIKDIEDEIFEGDSVAMLEELDKVDSSLLTEVVGTYNTDVDGSSKMFENLPAGIYYVRATNFPANVYSVQNSVFALPYYNATNGWQYFIDPIPLATKVDESNPEVVKTITNSTKDNVNFTDVSLGDTVNFEIEASRVGSANVVESKNFKLNSYVVSDIMESGLTLNQDSFVVTLEDIDGNTITTLEDTADYVVNIVANEGADTTFTVSLTPEYLAQDEFYSSANVVIAYSAVLNKYSTREFDGNYNTATDLTYSNKTNVSATVEGNTVYAYTFGIEVNKYDDAGTPLAGSEFGLYLTEDDAKAMQNAIATGTSTDTGKVEFFTESNDVIRLASGTYYIVETKATENYNRYTDVIPVTITAEYSETEANGTYLLSAPANGIQLVEVKNSKVVIPNTGGDGAMYRYLIAAAFAMLAVTLVVIKKRNTKRATETK